MFAKLIRNNIQEAPVNFKTPDGRVIVNFNRSETLMKKYGYKEILDIRPNFDPTKQFLQKSNTKPYIENDENILINYEVIDIIQQNTAEESIDLNLDSDDFVINNEDESYQSILDEEVNK